MTFLVNQPVRSKTSGVRFTVLGSDFPTLDGREVVMVLSADGSNFGPWLADDLEEDLG